MDVGSFDMTCAISGTPIGCDAEVYICVVAESPDIDEGMTSVNHISVWDVNYPITPLLKAIYDDYGYYDVEDRDFATLCLREAVNSGMEYRNDVRRSATEYTTFNIDDDNLLSTMFGNGTPPECNFLAGCGFVIPSERGSHASQVGTWAVHRWAFDSMRTWSDDFCSKRLGDEVLARDSAYLIDLSVVYGHLERLTYRHIPAGLPKLYARLYRDAGIREEDFKELLLKLLPTIELAEVMRSNLLSFMTPKRGSQAICFSGRVAMSKALIKYAAAVEATYSYEDEDG